MNQNNLPRGREYLVREAITVVADFMVVLQAFKDGLVGDHVDVAGFVYLLRRERLPCLKKEAADEQEHAG